MIPSRPKWLLLPETIIALAIAPGLNDWSRSPKGQWIFTATGALLAASYGVVVYKRAKESCIGKENCVCEVLAAQNKRLDEFQKVFGIGQMKVSGAQNKTLNEQMKVLAAQNKTLNEQMKVLAAQNKRLDELEKVFYTNRIEQMKGTSKTLHALAEKRSAADSQEEMKDSWKD